MMKSYEYYLVEAHRVITALHMAGFPGAVVAGGYLRDARLGIEPKDMDVFIPHCAQRDNSILCQNISAALGMVVDVQHNISAYANLEVCRIFDCARYQAADDLTQQRVGIPVQVIELRPGLSPLYRAPKNDFGICQVWMALDGQVQRSDQFDYDLRHKACTLVHAENDSEHARSIRRWDRLKSKLAPLGFRFFDATQFGQPAGDLL